MIGIGQVLQATLRFFGGRRQVDVVVNDGSGNPITAFGGSGGTASNFGSALPSQGTAAGYQKTSDGTMQAAQLDDTLALKVNVVAGGAGGGAVTVADGADVTEGAKADAAVTGDTSGSVSAKLRGLNKVLGGSGVITLQASQVSGVVNATTTRTTTTGLDLYTDLDILINITGGGAATGTLQLFLEDSADGGTSWDDLVASNTFTFGAAPTTQRFKVAGKISPSGVQGGALQQETLAAGNVRYGPFGERIRVREKVSGVGGAPTGVTYTITAVAKR